MSISGVIKTLFTDHKKTTALFPRTKVKAISDENGVGLEVLLDEKASKTYVAAKIAEAQLDGSDVDLSGYATKDELSEHTRNRNNPHGVTAAQVGADAEGTAAEAVSSHNTDGSAHADIRNSMSTLSVDKISRSDLPKGTPARHLIKLEISHGHELTTYQEVDGAITERAVVDGSDYIKCPKYLGIHFADSESRAYVYFYNLDEDGYTPNWSVIDSTTTSGIKNYLSMNSGRPYLFETDNLYMRIRVAVGSVEFFAWDGEHFGMPLSGDLNAPTTPDNPSELGTLVEALPTTGAHSVTIPGDAKYIISHTGYALQTINGYKGSNPTNLYSASLKSFVKLPSGYDFFRVRVGVPNPSSSDLDNPIYPIVNIGDMSELLSVYVNTDSDKPSGKALKILENCKKLCSIRWTPKSAIAVRREVDTDREGNQLYNEDETPRITVKAAFSAGVEYMGIPYGSEWQCAHFVGWHVSPHTFVNAVNDEDSIFYKERVTTVSDIEDGIRTVYAPYYSLVCSSFATLCAGWPYPATNRACLYDPNVYIYHSQVPPIGGLYSSMSHVVIPERIDYLDNDVAISAYECMQPVSQRSTRYGKVKSSGKIDVYHASTGYVYYDDYRYVYDHFASNPDLSERIAKGELYADTTDVDIVGGSARPYKGDKSVYTSAEKVLINIKDTSAQYLQITKRGSNEGLGTAIAGASQIDVRPHLLGDGIYDICTSSDPTVESFEYRSVTPVHYCIIDGVPVLDSQDFWYVTFTMRGDKRADGKSAPTCQLPASDYSYLIENGATCTSVYSIFKNGEYGAFSVPVEGPGEVLTVTGELSEYTESVGSFSPSYRIKLSTVKEQAGVDEVAVGSFIKHENCVYYVGYCTDNYVYVGRGIELPSSLI